MTDVQEKAQEKPWWMIKPFAWSFSKLKNFETCPRRYRETELSKSVEEQRSQELDRGDDLHDAMYNRVVGTTPLPPQFIYMEKWAKKLTAILHPFQVIQGELKLATDKNGTPTGYMQKNTWVRTKIDYLRILPREGYDLGHIVDYKTGKPPKVWDGTQLALNAWTVFKHFKTIRKIRADYLWTEYDDTNHQDFTRDDANQEMVRLTPRVTTLQTAIVNDDFPPKPGGLCKDYCPVSSCEFWGKAQRRAVG